MAHGRCWASLCTAHARPRGLPRDGRIAGLDLAHVLHEDWPKWSNFEKCEFLKTEILLGITICFAQVPESVAFSFVAGVPPIVGLYSTFFLGVVTAALGGKPAMISGAAGAMAVVVADLTADDGPLGAFDGAARFEQLLLCVLLCVRLEP